MSVAAHRAVIEASSVVVRTARHPAVEELRAQGVGIESFDHLYDTLPDFDTVYEAVATEVLQRAREPDFVYAVPGHPLVGERVYIRDFTGATIDAARTMLHARVLGFVHPRTGETMAFEREAPEDFQAMVAALRWK